jgi:MFS family permease
MDFVNRIRVRTYGYPRSFWFLFWGLLISRSGSSMVWPFLTIYMRQHLAVPLTVVTLLLTLNAIFGLAASFAAGPLVDRFGRKFAMTISLVASSAAFVSMSLADTLQLWAVLVALSGAFDPFYRVGANAMVADLVEPERRAGAYALLRMIANVGVAIGPMVGGFMISASYSLVFYIAAASDLIFGMLILFFVKESAPQITAEEARTVGSYRPVLRDRAFLEFCMISVMAGMAYAMMMVLLPVYVKENFGIVERQYGFIMAANALMVVIFQYGITRVSDRYHHLPVLAMGSLFYALGVGSVAFGEGFTAFLISMIVLTIGEMIVIPTSTALAANLAPVDMRGRYMGIFTLTWGLAFATGPVIGGVLNDQISPAAIWVGGFGIGLIAAFGFLILMRRIPIEGVTPEEEQAAEMG